MSKSADRYAVLVDLAEQQGVRVAVIAVPLDYQDIRVRDLRAIGDPADLGGQLDIIEAYLTGLRWGGIV